MTREEAIAKLQERMPPPDKFGKAMMIVDALQALGLIAFEPPKDKVWKFVGIFNGLFGTPLISNDQVRRALEAAGLEIVEKK